MRKIGTVGKRKLAARRKWFKENLPTHQGYYMCYVCGTALRNPELDHLNPRPHNGIPGRKRHEIVEKVLACYRCNHDRNVAHQRNKQWSPTTSTPQSSKEQE